MLASVKHMILNKISYIQENGLINSICDHAFKYAVRHFNRTPYRHLNEDLFMWSLFGTVYRGYGPDARLKTLVKETLIAEENISFNFDTPDRQLAEACRQQLHDPHNHYKFLSAMVSVIKPSIVIEIGTHLGLASLSMKETLPLSGKIFTYDIFDFKYLSKATGHTVLHDHDFDGRLEQRIIDLSSKSVQGTPLFQEQIDLFKKAELIFVDAAKDGKQEMDFIELLDSIQFNAPPIVIFDDIHFSNMQKPWFSIKHPKCDVSSLAHATGTGIVHWV